MSAGGSSGGIGGAITGGVSSIANIGAGWFADKQLAKGTAEAMQRQNQANKLYQGLYGQTQADYAPYQKGGASAFDALLQSYGLGQGQNGQADYSGFYNSPDYQFAMQQGGQALDRSAAARGRLYSGAQMEAQQKFGQGLATQYLGNYRNGLYNVAGTGMQANNALASYRSGYGNQLGQGYTNLGDLALARRIGRANINYKNVAAQDSIFGGMFGGAAQHGGDSSSFYSTMPSNYGSDMQGGGQGSSFNMNSGGWNSNSFSGGNNWLNQGLSGYGVG